MLLSSRRNLPVLNVLRRVLKHFFVGFCRAQARHLKGQLLQRLPTNTLPTEWCFVRPNDTRRGNEGRDAICFPCQCKSSFLVKLPMQLYSKTMTFLFVYLQEKYTLISTHVSMRGTAYLPSESFPSHCPSILWYNLPTVCVERNVHDG